MQYRRNRRGGGVSALSFFKKFGSGSFGAVGLLLPFGLLIFGGLYVVKWIKQKGGLMHLIGDFTGVSTLGQTQEQNEANKVLEQKAKAVLSKKGVELSAMHYSLANSIFTLMNRTSVSGSVTQLYSSVMVKEWQTDVLKVLQNIKLEKDVAGVYAAFGSRRVPNRESTLFGFIWDDNPLNLLECVNKFFDGNEKKLASDLLDKAIKNWLN